MARPPFLQHLRPPPLAVLPLLMVEVLLAEPSWALVPHVRERPFKPLNGEALLLLPLPLLAHFLIELMKAHEKLLNEV